MLGYGADAELLQPADLRQEIKQEIDQLYDMSARGFSLTPAYDIVPNLWQREHILSIAGKTMDITVDDLIREGKSFSLQRKHCLQMLNEAAAGVSSTMATDRQMLQLDLIKSWQNVMTVKADPLTEYDKKIQEAEQVRKGRVKKAGSG